jgi:hypothetical protein
VSRLARFNVTAETLAAGSDSGKVAYFEGTPIPTSVVLTAVLAFAAVAGSPGRKTLWRRLDSRPLGNSTAGAALHRFGQHDDQQDAAHSEALAVGRQLPGNSNRWRVVQ